MTPDCLDKVLPDFTVREMKLMKVATIIEPCAEANAQRQLNQRRSKP